MGGHPRRFADSGRVATVGDETFRIVDGIEDAAERVAWEAKTFRELGAL